MANVKCCLCLNNCLPENTLKVFDDKLDVSLPELIKKYLVVVVENDEENNTRICRMCFVHLLDFHYFFRLIEQKQQGTLQSLEPKIETISLTDSDFDGDDEDDDDDDILFLDDIMTMKSQNSGRFEGHIINETNDGWSMSSINYTTNNFSIQPDPAQDSLDFKMQILEDKLVLDSLANKFVYEDDSDIECVTDNALIAKNLQTDTNRKRKGTCEPDISGNVSIRETLIRLRRRTKNIYDVVDSNGHLRCNNASQDESSDYSPEPKRLFNKYRKKRGRPKGTTKDYNPKTNIRRSRSDAITTAIISNIGQLKCDECNTGLANFRELVYHFRKEHKHVCRPYAVCCAKRHYSPKTLANHILSHTNPELFKCEICGKVLGTQYSYVQHKRAKHSGKRKVYKCNVCGKKLISAKYFEVHVANHN